MGTVYEDNNAFLVNVVHNIPGWLLDYTALATMEILKFQEQTEILGSLFEIGIFAGRYFSVLLRSALNSDSVVVGLDTFQHVDQDRVISFLNSVSPDYGKLVLIKGPSSEWSARDLITVLGEPARFISIDGSHDKSDVFWDLRLAEEVISNKWVVAIDDFLNPVAFGVNEAVNQFFLQPRNLVPWAYLPNKLFLARPAWADRYKTFLEETVLRDEAGPESNRFRENLDKGRHHIEAPLFANKVLIII